MEDLDRQAAPPAQSGALHQALANYLSSLIGRYQFLVLQEQNDAASGQQHKIALQSVFINLPVTVAGQILDTLSPEELVQHILWGTPSVLQAIRQSVLQLVGHARALVLLGEPGTGKSTVLHYLAVSFALAWLQTRQERTAALNPDLVWDEPPPLPILIQLRHFAEELADAPTDEAMLLAYIEQLLASDQPELLAPYLLGQLTKGSVLLLCDGLDEVSNDTHRVWAAQAVALFQGHFPHCRIVLTSRSYPYHEPYQLPPPFQAATLRLADTELQDEFITRWYRTMLIQPGSPAAIEQEQAAHTRANDLITALERNPHLREISTNPLLLTMFTHIHQQHLHLPQQRAELYSECLQILLQRWDSPSAAIGLPDQTTWLELIQPIAYQLQALGHTEAHQAELRDWLLPRLIDLSGDLAAAHALIDRLLAFLEGRAGVLIARNIRDAYAFIHPAFQEYLVARAIISQGSQHIRAEVRRRRRDASWREVILLIAGHLANSDVSQEQASGLAQLLLDADTPGTTRYDRNTILVGEIIEQLTHAPKSTKADVIARLVALVQGGRLPAKERVAAAFVLGRLGDPRLPSPAQQEYWCEIDAGRFWHGDDRQKQPLRQHTLAHSFRIARYTVTNAEYRHFVEDSGYDPRHPWWTQAGRAWLSDHRQGQPAHWHDPDFNGPTQPVVRITWYEASAYCAWLTHTGHQAGWLPKDKLVRLPTSLEWERAARHTEKRRYPWGQQSLTPEWLNYAETEIGRTAPVGCFPLGAAVCGAHDILGNVSELLEDQEMLAGAYTAFRSDGEQLCCGAHELNLPDAFSFEVGFRIVLLDAPVV